MHWDSVLSHTVILRLWREPAERADGPAEWRGEAVHVPSGQVRYFRSLEAAVPVLYALLDPAAAGGEER
jgi:hypothetical protein